jgi:hypothetical protein
MRRRQSIKQKRFSDFRANFAAKFENIESPDFVAEELSVE